MIRVHCTQKLIAKLPLDESGRLCGKKKPATIQHAPNDSANETAESLLSNWHANLLTLQRRNCVLFVHDATRFPVFVPCLQKADLVELRWHFTDVFMNTLLKVGADDQIMQRAHNALSQLAFDIDCNRSVQGTVNRMAQDVAFLLRHDDNAIINLQPYSTSVWLAERPCSAKGVKDWIWPVKAMLNLLA